MAERKVVVVGFTQYGKFTYGPLVEKLYANSNIVWLDCIGDLFNYRRDMDSICLNLFSLGYDADKSIKRIRKYLGRKQIVCIGSYHVSKYTGKMLVYAGADVIFANIHSETEYSNMLFALQNNLRYYPKNIRDFISTRHDYIAPSGFYRLSLKERTNLDMSCDGKTLKEIALMMKINPGTVSTMRRNTLRKTGLENWEKVVSYGLICKFAKGEA